jgi:PAS domain S-box-containing protein
MSDDGTTAPVRDEPRTSNDRPAAAIAEHERQFREILEYCPAGLNVVDEQGRLLFHNARLRKLMGYDEEEMHLFDTKRFWHDLEHRARIIESLRQRGGELLNEEAVWKTKDGGLVHVLISYVQVAYRGGHVSFLGG